jgi:hypothetical protein
MFVRVVMQLADRPVGKRQAHIRGPLLGHLDEALELKRTQLRGTTGRVGRTFKASKPGPVEFGQTAIGGVLGATHLARGGQHAHPAADQPDQLVALGHPLGQLAIVQFGFKHLFLAAPEAAQL